MKVILETERLYLREFTLDDAQLMLELNSDPDVVRYTGDPFPWENVEGVKKIMTEVMFPQYEKNLGRWAAHLKDDHTFLGWCGLKDVGSETDLGYRFAKKYWGKGYATESAKAVLDHGMNRLGLTNIIGRASVHNTASINVLRKIGLIFKEQYKEGEEDSVKFLQPGFRQIS